MTCNRYIRLSTVSAIFLCLSAQAKEYSFEVDVAYGQSETDTTTDSIPAPINSTVTSSAETDGFDLRGSWFYSRLSDEKGPKKMAAFVDRASSVSVSYSQSNLFSSIVTSDNGTPPVESYFSIDVSAYSVDFRHIWKKSGWYGLAGIGGAKLDREFSSGSIIGTSDTELNAYSLGVGKYVAKTTSIDLRLVSQDSGTSSAGGVSLNLNHLASLGDTWMFSANFGLTKTDTAGDGDAYNIRGALYPNTDVDFGLSYVRRDEEDGVDFESFELFAGWFVTGSTRVYASYKDNAGEAGLGAATDSSGFEVGISSRF